MPGTQDIKTTAALSRTRGQRRQRSRSYAGDSGAGWVSRLWSAIRRVREAGAPRPQAVVESGTVAVGDVRNPSVAIPADIMFSPERTALYSAMTSLLVRNPYYISSIIYAVKYHECDGLLAIILNSLFGNPAHEPSLAALFTRIVELEVDRTETVDTLMRNDAPSVHMLSAYLRNRPCLDYLRVALGPTVKIIADLGRISLDPDLAAVYQDWARAQRGMRLSPVVSSVEAASYTEVQNLSRRRQQHLMHVATHCLFDIINARHHVPAGLQAICASTLQATRRKFPEVDETRGYSLVGGVFFLRFVNAALATPNQYGLLDCEPEGTVKTNLKLVARLMQRLSNNSGKPPEEWPLEARRFIKINVERLNGFLGSLTDAESGGRGADSEGRGLLRRRVRSAVTLASRNGNSPGQKAVTASERGVQSLDYGRKGGLREDGGGQCGAMDMKEIFSYRVKTLPWFELRSHRTKANGPCGLLAAPSLADTLSAEKPPGTFGRLPGEPDRGSDGSTPDAETSPAASEKCSARSMFDMGRAMLDSDTDNRRPSRSGTYGDVELALNDLYLLQKYLLMYEDAWAGSEKQNQLADVADTSSETPIRRCLAKLGPAPALVRATNNHRIRIALE
ncbi:RasGAP protein [Coemansia sp. RSA 552]|nr:RasGAP protein [Coemansia sp. RSA 552]